MPSAVRTWLQLLRAPNLVTVPGDPLAGYLLACFGLVENNLWPVMAASLCFYGGGLLLNDLVNRAEDRRERPNRPLPSGAVSASSVAAAAAILFIAALIICWKIDRVTFGTGGALLFAIVLYNCATKHIPLLGALNMGLCRALSLMLGATAVSHGDLTYRLIAMGRLDHLPLAAGITGAYIASVTHLARFETRSIVPKTAAWLPTVVLAAGGAAFVLQLTPAARIASLFLFLIAALSAFQTALHLTREAGVTMPPQIGVLIRLVLLVQAAFCAAIGGIEGSLAAGLLVLLWPISRLLSRWFYAS